MSHALAYPIREVAALLSVSDRTIWRMAKAGEIQVLRFPGRRITRVPASEVSRLLRTQAPRYTPTDPDVLRMAREMMRKIRP